MGSISEAFANELKKARRIESLTKLVKTQPAVSQTSAIGKIDKFEVILEALSKHVPMGQVCKSPMLFSSLKQYLMQRLNRNGKFGICRI